MCLNICIQAPNFTSTMVNIPPDERTIYLAFKDVFKGPDARLRTDKAIKRRIRKYRTRSEEIQALLKEHNIDNVRNSVKALLEGDVFASTLRAKIHFPELFDISPAQSAERAASEVEAAKNEAEAIREVVVGQQDGSISTPAHAEYAGPSEKPEKQEEPENEISGSTGPLPASVQKKQRLETFAEYSLYPSYLPAKSQRRLLGKVQDMLEDACYKFGKRTMMQELRKNGWDSPDCVELNAWMGIFRFHETLFSSDKLAAVGKPFPDLRNSISQIRHAAVHRLRITAGRVETLLADAETLAVLLEDEACARQLSRLRRETHLVVEEFGRNKDLLELRFMDKRKEIAARRAELDRLERTAWTTALEEDKLYQIIAGSHLEEIADAPETTLHSAANSDGGETSEEDTSVASEGPDQESFKEPLSSHLTL
ncbi:hypothetical protein C7974DRAFT_142230 [Boeremia exigua]|uniref:uncharacterized protein n=1 Tax=Boeremia exigua TaxID=749465 RepID=UPI001E8CEB98|nr:uncharacterized protein C7974DRAFT_142230 [Boeremia exigua]KAH6637488.1 hypothetical protein C7974DRAFT_142230 [Boeremia exigua]